MAAQVSPERVGSAAAVSEGKGDVEQPQAADDDKLTSEERWCVVWAAVNVYYTYDATIGLIIASAAFLAGLIFKLILAADCDSKAWIISLVVLSIRALDVFTGCCGMLRQPVPTRREFFCDILRNMLICIVLGILAIALFVVAATKVGDSDCSKTSVISMISAGLLLFQAGEELVIWCVILFLWCIASRAKVPDYVDSCIPDFVRRRVKARRAKEKVTGDAH